MFDVVRRACAQRDVCVREAREIPPGDLAGIGGDNTLDHSWSKPVESVETRHSRTNRSKK